MQKFYKKFTNVPFIGEVSGIWNGNFKDGKEEGLWERYYENGQLREKGNYKNGIEEGSREFYNKNGELGKVDLIPLF